MRPRPPEAVSGVAAKLGPGKWGRGIYQENGLSGHKFEKQSYELVADRSWQAGKAELMGPGRAG